MQNTYTFQNMAGQTIYLTFDRKLFSPCPDHVLIVPIYQDRLLFTKHKTRGWELPGGKIDPGETPLQAIHREAWEETGAILTDVYQIGEYTVEKDNMKFTKAIFLASVVKLEERPTGFETIGVAYFPMDVDTMHAQFSSIMQDDVFRYIKCWLSTERISPT